MSIHTFRIRDGYGSKEREGETTTAAHGLLKGVGRKEILQTLDVGTYIPLGVWLYEGERERDLYETNSDSVIYF